MLLIEYALHWVLRYITVADSYMWYGWSSFITRMYIMKWDVHKIYFKFVL